MEKGEITWADKLRLGQYTLKNRLILCALTRTRCDPKTGVPNDLHITYYGQRAGAGLCLTEASSWCQRSISYPGAADMFNQEQADGWKKVVEEVHKKGGLIYLQMFHGGRVTHSQQNGGLQPWAPSAIALRGETLYSLGGINFPTPKEMTLEDIKITQQEFQKSLDLAKYANFDGVQLHGANGYLIDQFLRSFSNRRSDQYGGSAENRVRFVTELVDIALRKFKPYQIGIKINPTNRNNDMFDQNPVETYTCLMKELDKRNVGFVEILETLEKDDGPSAHFHIPGKEQIENICKVLRPHFNGLIFANFGFNPQTGLDKIKEGHCDAISFGRYYIANPDLAQRVLIGAPLNTNWDYKTFYGTKLQDKSKGYTDYPFYSK